MITLKLQLDWKPNAQFAGILLAHYLGQYQRAGINLVIVPGPLPADPLSALKAGENVIVCADDNLIIQARAAGQPVKAIAAMFQYSALGWMALKESGIHTMTDLKGKRLGVHKDGEMALDIALTHFGLSQAEVEIVEFGLNYAEVLRSGQCDAIQGFIITEPLELEEMGLELQVFPAYEWSYEAYAQVLVTTERLLATQPDVLRCFLQITFAGWRRALQNPHEVSRIITTHYLMEARPELEMFILLALRPFLEGKVGQARLGWMEKSRWERSIDYLVNYGVLDRRLTAEEVMTNALMEAVYQNEFTVGKGGLTPK
ncbi:MAG: ABC transporter substrate-binding protein [Anaerolineae bacterium]